MSRRTLTRFLSDLFVEYDRGDVQYCLLRNYEKLPEHLESRDVDILISSRSRRKNRDIVSALAKEYEAEIYNHYVDERFDQIFLFRRGTADGLFELKLDFFFDSELYGVCVLSGVEILRARRPYKNFYIAHDTHKVLDKWLFVYLLGANLPYKYHAEFRNIFIEHREALSEILTVIFGKRSAIQLLGEICEAGFSNLPRIGKRRLFAILFGLVCRKPLYHMWHLPLFLWCRLENLLNPKGEFISVSGPDGCGKTTVLELAKVELETLFCSSPESFGHFRPSILPRIAQLAQRTRVIDAIDENYASPHRGKPSGSLGSLLRFIYYLADYTWGYFIKIRPALVRRELVIYDRYYFDMVADPGRSRIALPYWLRKAALFMIPLPHTAFFVNVPAKAVYQRKQELSLEKIEQLNVAYQQMVDSSHLHGLDNSGTSEEAAARLVNTAIKRRRKRLKLDVIYT